MSDKRIFRVAVTQIVEVKLDASKFDEVFMQEFRESFYNFHTVDEHAEHIAQLEARGLIGEWKPFIEGYGPAEDMGITAKVVDTEIDMVLP